MRMSKPNRIRSRAQAFATLLAWSLAACSSSERTDLILTDVDLTEVPTTASLSLSVLAADGATVLSQEKVSTPALTNGVAKIGLSQNSSMTGSVFVRVLALDLSGGILGSGQSAAVAIVPGKNAGPALVKVKATGAVGGDAAILGPEGPEAGVKWDGGTIDGIPGEVGDAKPADDADRDVPYVGGPEAPDGAPVMRDVPLDTADAPADVWVAPVDTSPDGGAKEVGNILNTLASCQKYVHYPNSPATCSGTQEDVWINTVAFSPDGKYLLSAANNTWVKIWKVVAGGLEDTKANITGTNFYVTAAVSPDSNIVAVGNSNGNVNLYDLATTVRVGAASELGVLDAKNLAYRVYNQWTWPHFTTDGRQLVMTNSATGTTGDHMTIVAVWDLATRTLVREFDFDFATNPSTVYAVGKGPSTGPIWVVLGNDVSVRDDAGTHSESTVTLFDASGSTTAKPSFVFRGTINRAAFSPDGRTLAIGTGGGEVSLWDLSSLSNIQRLGSPLVEPSSSGDSVTSLGFSAEGQFLAAGSWIWSGPSSLRIINLQSKAVIKLGTDWEPRTFAFASNGSTWAYGLGGCGFLYFCQ